MAGLKELRNRIEAVKSTEKITSAMKMVAAARLRRAQSLLEHSNKYAAALNESAMRLLSQLYEEELTKNIKFFPPEMMRKKADNSRRLELVFGASKGLCGSYNSNINRFALSHLKQLEREKKDFLIYCFGKKANDFIKKHYPEKILGYVEDFAKKGPQFDECSELSAFIQKMCAENKLDVCEAVYANFKTALSRDIVCEQILPLEFDEAYKEGPNHGQSQQFYFYEPDKLKFLEQILPMIFEAKVFDIVVESQASEHGARMSSMDNATRNASEMINKLTLRYNTIRQSAITTELIEIIAGAEAI